MANDVQAKTTAKFSGYLEKKGKLKMVSSWKKYWFVLEGRLLLYYRSKAEYEAIGACKGSFTLGPPCSIKPILASSSCTFQIEARTNIITLRAENKIDYEHWMKAILHSLEQFSRSTTAKAYHFRYSENNLTSNPKEDKQVSEKQLLSRQNTMPDRLNNIKETSSSSPNLLDRLQKLGTRSYGGSLQSINKFYGKGSPKLPKNESLQRLLKNHSADDVRGTSKRSEYFQIVKTVKCNNKRCPRRINDEYMDARLRENCTCDENNVIDINKSKIEVDNRTTSTNLQEDIFLNRISEEYTGNDETITSFMGDIDYCPIDDLKVNKGEIKESYNKDMNDNETNSKSIRKVSSESDIIKETIRINERVNYVPINHGHADYQFTPIESEVHPQLEQRLLCNEEFNQDSGTSEMPSKKPSGGKLRRKLSRLVSDRRKTGSFVVKVLKKIRRNDREEEHLFDAKEEFDDLSKKSGDSGEKIMDPDIKLLNEMQALIDNKKEIIQEKVISCKHNNLVYNENGFTPDNSLHDTIADVQTQVEVHKSDEHSFANGKLMENSNTSNNIFSDKQTEEAPKIPPKQNRRHLIVLQYPEPDEIDNFYIPRLKLKYNRNSSVDFPPRTQPTYSNIHYHQHPGVISTSEEKLKTIDEILDDLDREKLAEQDEKYDIGGGGGIGEKQNVKQLIEKYESCQNVDDVEMRQKESLWGVNSRYSTSSINRVSDDLNVLLLELSKVTSAPITTPRVTNSLTNTILVTRDDEWWKMVSLRKRRLSEPDYDIPRPHSSLQIIKKEKNTENAIEPTRFFGPALMDPETLWQNAEEYNFAPDSLEIFTTVDQQNRKCNKSINDLEDQNSTSYHSHHYLKHSQSDKYKNDGPKSVELYQQHGVNFGYPNDDYEQCSDDDDPYEDSLEPRSSRK